MDSSHLKSPHQARALQLNCYVFSLALIILAGDMETNPGPIYSQPLSICHMNACSLPRVGWLDDIQDEMCRPYTT